MIKRLGAFSVLTIVALAAAGAAPAAAEYRLSVDAGKRAVRLALHADFEGGIRKGSLRLDCARDGARVRCGVDLHDRRGRTWCGSATARPVPGTADGTPPRIITRFRLQRSDCAA